MSIRIDNITRGRFGNKILQYNSLIQIANNNNIKASCCIWEGNKFFKNINSFIESKKEKKHLLYKSILDNEELNFDNYEYIIDDPAYCLHNIFYKITNKDPREFLQLKDEYKPQLHYNYIYIGIHFRGGDNITIDNGREIHEFKYYKDSIDYLITEKIINDNYLFILCTDDINFNSFIETFNYLKKNKYNYQLGPSTLDQNKHFIYDWSILSECDILINSSSTFCLTAGFLGKKNKFIIHSIKWIEKNINYIDWNSNGENTITLLNHNLKSKEYWKSYDNFWIQLSKLNNNMFCYCNKLI